MLQQVNDRLGGHSQSRVHPSDKHDRLRARDVENNSIYCSEIGSNIVLLKCCVYSDISVLFMYIDEQLNIQVRSTVHIVVDIEQMDVIMKNMFA